MKADNSQNMLIVEEDFTKRSKLLAENGELFHGFSETERQHIRSKANGMNQTEYVLKPQGNGMKGVKSDKDQRNKIMRQGVFESAGI